MIINEPDDRRQERLRQYRICQERGHVASYGLGEMSVCGKCGVHYQFKLEEEVSSLPTGVNRGVPGTNMIQWVEDVADSGTGAI